MDITPKLYKPFTERLKKLNNTFGEEFQKLNGFSDENLNFTDFIDNFVDSDTVADTTIDSNANSSTHDIRTLLSDMTKPHLKLLAYNKIYYELEKEYGRNVANRWLEGEYRGDFYLHDASTSTFIPYCYAYDLDKLVERGLFFINKFKTKPAQHLTTYNDHVLEFISWNANRTSGAVGIPSYLLYSFYFWNKDVKEGFYLKDPEYYRRQCFQKFVHDLNQPYLRVTECAFTNISIMDRNYLIELFGGRKFPNGECVIDYIDAIIEHQKVFMEVVSDIRKDTMMTFPVLTYSLLYKDGKFVDEDFAKWCNKHNMNWYDSNFYISEDVTSLSSCCRMVNEMTKINAFINSIGGTSLSIGSVKVNTVNLRRIALEIKDKNGYIIILKHKTELALKVLHVVRNIIKRNIEKGLLPNYTYELIEMDKQFNSLGITAMYEALREYDLIECDEFGNHYYSKEGMDFACDIMQAINEVKTEFEKTVNYSINIEAIPAERANVVLCKKDNLLYNPTKEYEIYSNQWIPLTEQCTLQEKIRLGSILDRKCGGGQISHINIDAPFLNEKQSWDMLNYIASQGVIYFAYNTRISVCENEHAFYGETCPNCGNPKCDEYTRVVGFLTPLSSYSKERKTEAKNRKYYNIEKEI